jgi:polyisoprenoid-binding protein YceI
MSTTSPEVLTGTYNLDPSHSRIGFSVRHAMVSKVRGTFHDAVGEGFFDASNPSASRFSVTIQAASIDTGNADRDTHLKSNDFFEMDTYPTITFTSTAVSGSDEQYTVTGDLTLKGITKSITFDLELSGPSKDPFGFERIGLEGSVQVNRKDWNLSWNAPLETGGVLIAEKVTLEFDIEATKVTA